MVAKAFWCTLCTVARLWSIELFLFHWWGALLLGEWEPPGQGCAVASQVQFPHFVGDLGQRPLSCLRWPAPREGIQVADVVYRLLDRCQAAAPS